MIQSDVALGSLLPQKQQRGPDVLVKGDHDVP